MLLQALLLAAGSSQRFNGDKLLRPTPTSRCLLDIGYQMAKQLTDHVLVIIRDDTPLHQHCQQHQYPCLVNPSADSGMASSIVAGVNATAKVDGWAIFLADMPAIQKETLQRLATTWTKHAITLPTWQEQDGHPVIFSGKYRKALTSLQGDRGARVLLRDNSEVYRVDTDDAGVCFDIDTDADWETWLRTFPG